MQKIDLGGSWKVLECPLSRIGTRGLGAVKRTRGGWIDVRVPGEIHIDLMRAGRMPEPLVSTNAPRCRWPEKRSWWFRTFFDVPQAFLGHERQELVFEGIDLFGQVFVNGELLGEAVNAFVPAVFDVRGKLRAKRNEVVVRVTCGAELAPSDDQPKPIRRRVYGNRNSFPGVAHLRKPQFSYGWDWVDALPNIGLWRPVGLRAYSGVVLDDIRLDTVVARRRVYLDTTVTLDNLHPWSERPCRLELSIKPPSGRIIRHIWQNGAQAGLSRVHARIEVPGAKLWWPNGIGEQPLYDVTVRVLTGRRESDRRQLRIGLRTVDIDRSPLAGGGSRFCIRVNGKDVFCKGGNWVPADGIIARVTEAKYRRLVSEAVAANLNMLRVWGGGVYESPAFYKACDEAGILVWQDFMFACAQYPDHRPEFRNAVRDEAEAVVRSLRNHPCIALWSGNNENHWAFAQWWNNERLARGGEPKVGGAFVYNRILPEVCGALDPGRPYWPGSPYGGDLPNSETDGDCHWWGQGTMNRDINRRIRDEVYDECTARFVSEYGVIGPCSMASVRQFLEPGEIRVGSKAWREHTNTFEKDTTPAAIRYHYADPEGLDVESYILYGQMFQAVLYGRSIEALRFRKHDPVDDCQGALVWMFNDCWGEHGWSPIDYYLRRKPSYYWIRNACAPVRAIVRRRGNDLVTRIVNDTLQPIRAVLRHGWMRVDGTEERLRSRTTRVPGNGMRELARDAIAPEMDQTAWIYAAFFEGEFAATVPATWQGVPYRQLAVPEPDIRARVSGRTVTLESGAYAHGVHVNDDGEGVFSDNYLDLLPGLPRKVRIEKPASPKRLRFAAVGRS